MALTAELTYVGRTSLEVLVHVHAENLISGLVTHTNSAYFVFVALDQNGAPTAVPGLLLETDSERAAFAEAQARQAARLQRAKR